MEHAKKNRNLSTIPLRMAYIGEHIIVGRHGPTENPERVPQKCDHHANTSAPFPPMTNERPTRYFYTNLRQPGEINSIADQKCFRNKSDGASSN